MQKRAKIIWAALLIYSITGIVYAAQEGQDSEIGRYAFYSVVLDDKPALILLDTKTGRTWMYQKTFSGTTSSEEKFKGITVEGLACGLSDSKRLDLYVNEMDAKGLLDKEVRGFADTLDGQFSYDFDLKKMQVINEKLAAEQAAAKKD